MKPSIIFSRLLLLSALQADIFYKFDNFQLKDTAKNTKLFPMGNEY